MKLFKEVRKRAERRLRLEERKEAKRHRETAWELDFKEYKSRAYIFSSGAGNRGVVAYVEV